jgi:type IV pilus assembly protein PilC
MAASARKPIHYKVTLRNKVTKTQRDVVVSAFTEMQAKLAALPGEKEQILKVKQIDTLEALLQGELLKFRPSLRDVLVFFRDLASLLKMGVPMLKALRLQIGVARNPKLRTAITMMIGTIEEGRPFSEAIAEQAYIFNPAMIALVRAGEASGELPQVLKNMATTMERSYKIFKKLKQAMIYPAIVMVGAAGVVYIFTYQLVPALAGIYSQFGAQLPALSRGVIGFSNLLRNYPILAPLPALVPITLIVYWKKLYAQPWMQRLAIHLPVIGKLVRKASLTKALRTLAMLVVAKVDIREALKLAAISCGNTEYEKTFLSILKHVENGETLHEGFAKHVKAIGKDGPQLAAFIQSAQEAGTINDTLLAAAALMEEDLDEMAQNIATIIEPIIFLALALFVGVLLYAVYSPIFNLSKVMLKR